jgi:hypothetical protein
MEMTREMQLEAERERLVVEMMRDGVLKVSCLEEKDLFRDGAYKVG